MLLFPLNCTSELMADSSVPPLGDSADGDDTSSPSPEWCAEQWSVLCEVLDVSDPTEVVPRVRALQDETDASPPGPVTDAFEEMQAQLETLRDRNAELLEYLKSSTDTSPPPADGADDNALHPDTEALLDQLDASSLTEAAERVESLTEQIDHLYREKEQLAEAGLMSAEEALDEIDRLQKKCDRLDDQTPSPQPSPDAAGPSLASLDLDSKEDVEAARALAEEADAALGTVVEQFEGDSSSPDASDRDFLATLRSLRSRATTLRSEATSLAASTEVADVLGIETAEDAHELEQIVRRMSDTLDALRDHRDTLMDELGVAAPQDVLALVRSLEDQLREFYDAQTQSTGDQLAAQIEEVLGISSVEEAHELETLVHRMNQRLEEVSSAHEELQEAGYDPETALATINSMEEQLVSLYGEREEDRPESSADEALVDAVTNVLGLSTPAEVRQMNESVRRMSEHLDALRADHQALADAGLTAEDALLMLENMGEQLSTLYDARDERSEALLSQIDALTDTLGVKAARTDVPQDALEHVLNEVDALTTAAQAAVPDHESPTGLADALQVLLSNAATNGTPPDRAAGDAPTAIQDVLGISTVEEAEDLAAVAENMSEQLEALYADRETLQEVGVTSVESAVQMIKSMSAQLDELYEEQEMLQGRPAPAEVEQQDTFEQLAALYSEQEKLERALGISEADEVIEMVEALTAQLEDVYSDREVPSGSTDASASVSPPDVSVPNGTEPPHNGSDRNGSARPERLTKTPVFASMRDQLESLYEEKEALLDMGIDDARTAAGRIDTLEARLSSLQHEHEQCRDRLEYLKRELGTTDVEEIVDMIGAVPADDDADTSGRETAPSPAASDTGDDEPTPVVLPEETLNDIDDLPEEALDDLSVGAVRLDADGMIEYLNDAALSLPGLDTVADRSELLGEFFFQAVPSTSNTLFLNRFRTGVDREQMDVRFPYTFVSPDQPPTAFYVHLYRSGPAGANWILLRPAR